jgi:predicted NAD/FAD-binding protein
MSAAIWSTPNDKTSLDFPARALARFLYNHNLLHAAGDTPDWLTFAGSS